MKMTSPTARGVAQREPIAIVGIGCRFPGGVDGPESFWRLLEGGVDAITEVPPDRWNADVFYDPDRSMPGKMVSRWGGFLGRLDGFDSGFFGISPREAAHIDPQQRLLLEVAWEAVEDAGLDIARLAGSQTGVFVGLSTRDFNDIQHGAPEEMDGYSNIGGAGSIAANRISYTFDWLGPSFAVDTACSSSLVAFHLACQSLWAGESSLALCGGVNVMLNPQVTLGLSQAGMLSPDGRCRSFDAAANGYVRGEGAGLVVLKPLANALADGDAIYALVRGTGVNQDGRTNGMTVPNGDQQERLCRVTCAEAGISPAQVAYVEAHGTGTPVGDPIEAKALGAVFGAGRPAGNCSVLGSVKTNIGHLEAGAGIAGLIKLALSLDRRTIPPNLHFSEPNPDIPFDALGLRVAGQVEPWPALGGRRLGAINSFGFGGTNAHAVLEEAPAPRQPASSPSGRAELLTLSARSDGALATRARQVADALAEGGTLASVGVADLCHTASRRRSHQAHRLSVVGRSRNELREQLEAFGANDRPAGLSAGRRPAGAPPKLAFVFSGMGPQWWAMARGLLAQEPVFREAVERCDALFQAQAGWSILDELSADETRSRMGRTEVAQPANFAVQVGLAALWRSWGVVPDAIVGHSAGEVAAAHVAGALRLEEAVRVIYHRSRLQQRAAGLGKMAAIGLSAEATAALLDGYGEHVSIAAINGPASVTLAGDEDALEAVLESVRQTGAFCRALSVEVPYHSHHMDPLQTELLASLRDLEAQPTTVPLYSTVSGDLSDGLALGAEYWWHNVRETVQFAAAVQRLRVAGHETFVELSPHPVLASAIAESAVAGGRPAVALPSLRRQDDDRTVMLGSLGALYVRGYPVTWEALHPNGGRIVRLPSYPWQRDCHWHEPPESRRLRLAGLGDPLLGHRLPSAQPTWRVRLHERLMRSMRDHRIQGEVILPGAAQIVMALAAAEDAIDGDGTIVIEQLEFQKPLFIPNDGPPRVHLTYSPDDGTFEISSQPDDGEQTWTRHSRGRLARRPWRGTGPAQAPTLLEEVRARCTVEVDGAALYDRLGEVGLQLGPTFQSIQRIWRRDGEVLAEVVVPDSLAEEVARYPIHPALLDACLQSFAGVVRPDRVVLMVPASIESLRFYARPGRRSWAHARLVHAVSDAVEVDVRLVDGDGAPLVEFQGLRARALEDPARAAAAEIDSLLYTYDWRPGPRPARRAGDEMSGDVPSPSAILGSFEIAPLTDDPLVAEYYHDLRPRIDALVRKYIVHALRELGWNPRPGDPVRPDAVAASLRIAPRHRQFLGRLLEILDEDGVLAMVDDGWIVRQVPDLDRPDQALREVMTEFPTHRAVLGFIGRCGDELAGVLCGGADPVQLLFPGGDLSNLTEIYRDSPFLGRHNDLVRKTVCAAVPGERPVRILEVGAGTGGLTAHVLPALAGRAAEYVFTDVSGVFLRAARQAFEAHDNVRYEILDLEADPLAQGFEAQGFDLVLASNVLHATRDLHETLGHIRQLLAPGGILVLVELTGPTRWIDLTFGMTEGWWRFEDRDLRPSYPLLLPTGWPVLLRDAGFEDVVGVPDPADPHQLGQTMFLTRRPRAEVAPEQPDQADAPAREGRGAWLVLADRGGTGAALADLLRTRGALVTVAYSGDADTPTRDGGATRSVSESTRLRHLLEQATVAGESAPIRVVHLWALDAPTTETATTAALEASEGLVCGSVLDLVQALSSIGDGPARLWLVTRGADAVDGGSETVAVAQAPLLGLGRIVMGEHAQLRCSLIDLDPDGGTDATALFAELWSQDESGRAGQREEEVALRGGRRYVRRLERTTVDALPARLTPSDSNARLEVAHPGVLDSLKLRAYPRRAPGPGEVEVRIRAAGLNFKDVLAVMAMVPFDLGLLGLEGAGTVTAVGQGVEHVRPGDAVVVVAEGTHRRYVTTLAQRVLPKPSGLSFEEAAGQLLVFMTAHIALHELARIKAGERVLIHAATGGVGLAAIQLARRVGAEIFATAGSPEKREYLKLLGIEHVMDSRSLAFADEILERTNGEGVDVVLNSLAGEAIQRGVDILRPYGRFIELGKRDLFENRRLGLRALLDNCSFSVLDITPFLLGRPDEGGAMARGILAGLEDGTLQPLPSQVFPLHEAGRAFRHMAQARHIGKVILSTRDGTEPVAPPSGPVRFRSDGTYLITGGLGGVGLATARWLVEHGARHIVLVGRRAPSPEAAAIVDELQADGAQVVVAQADVSREAQVAGILAELARTMPPLRGVIHGAMVLADGVIVQLDRERLARVMAPKMLGAWNLHVQTADCPLDFFVLYSSGASICGSLGQANYAAGNAFLDALAQHRRLRGRPGLAVNWGRLGDTGYVARSADVGERLDRIGFESVGVALALDALGRLLGQAHHRVVVARMDWAEWGAAHPFYATSPRYAQIVGEATRKRTASAGPLAADASFGSALRAAAPEARASLLTVRLADHLARVLGIPAAKLDREQRLNDLGLDSLMAVELKNHVEADLDIDLPIMSLLRGPSIAELAASIQGRLLAADGSAAVPGAGEAPSAGDGRLATPASPSSAKPAETNGHPAARNGSGAPPAVAAPLPAPTVAAGVAAAPTVAATPGLAVASEPRHGAVSSAGGRSSATGDGRAPAGRIVAAAREAEIAGDDVSSPGPHPPASVAAVPWFRRAARRLGEGLLRIVAQVEVEGADNVPRTGPLLVAGNHLHMLDIVVMYCLSQQPIIPFAAGNWRHKPIAGWFLEHVMQAIFVNRGAADLQALDRAVAVLRAGGFVGIAPEGTRSKTGGLSRARTGIAYLAMLGRAPVLPVVVFGQEQAGASWRKLRRVPVRVRIGCPIDAPTGELHARNLQAFADVVMTEMARLLPPEYRGVYAESADVFRLR